MKTVRWTEQAERDLDRIHDYIALDKLSAADKFVGRVLDRVDGQADFPGTGRIFEPEPSVRHVGEGKYRIYYRPDEEGIQVVRVLSGDMDPERILTEIKLELAKSNRVNGEQSEKPVRPGEDKTPGDSGLTPAEQKELNDWRSLIEIKQHCDQILHDAEICRELNEDPSIDKWINKDIERVIDKLNKISAEFKEDYPDIAWKQELSTDNIPAALDTVIPLLAATATKVIDERTTEINLENEEPQLALGDDFGR